MTLVSRVAWLALTSVPGAVGFVLLLTLVRLTVAPVVDWMAERWR